MVTPRHPPDQWRGGRRHGRPGTWYSPPRHESTGRSRRPGRRNPGATTATVPWDIVLGVTHRGDPLWRQPRRHLGGPHGHYRLGRGESVGRHHHRRRWSVLGEGYVHLRRHRDLDGRRIRLA